MSVTSRRRRFAQSNAWTSWIFSGPLPAETVRKLALWLGIACAAFTVLTYQILFGAVVSQLHSRTNFHRHDIALSAPDVATDGSVKFDAYVDAGPDTGAVYVVAAKLLDGSGQAIAQWDGAALAALSEHAIRNAYPYAWASRFKTERIGFSGQTGRTRDDHIAADHHATRERQDTYPRARGHRRQHVADGYRRQVDLLALVGALQRGDSGIGGRRRTSNTRVQRQIA